MRCENAGKPKSNTRRRTGSDHVARFQLKEPGHIGDDRRAAENKILRSPILITMPIDLQPKSKISRMTRLLRLSCRRSSCFYGSQTDHEPAGAQGPSVDGEGTKRDTPRQWLLGTLEYMCWPAGIVVHAGFSNCRHKSTQDAVSRYMAKIRQESDEPNPNYQSDLPFLFDGMESGALRCLPEWEQKAGISQTWRHRQASRKQISLSTTVVGAPASHCALVS